MATERIAHVLLQHVSEHIYDQKKTKRIPKFENKASKKQLVHMLEHDLLCFMVIK